MELRELDLNLPLVFHVVLVNAVATLEPEKEAKDPHRHGRRNYADFNGTP